MTLTEARAFIGNHINGFCSCFGQNDALICREREAQTYLKGREDGINEAAARVVEVTEAGKDVSLDYVRQAVLHLVNS